MARGGYRPGAGRPPKKALSPEKNSMEPMVTKGFSPLEYMLHVMNDANADEARRDKMAIAAAPFGHGKPNDAAGGKKAERQQAAENIGGRFAPPPPPNRPLQ